MIENFGKNVAYLRKRRGLTQTNLASEVGINKQTISNIEKGEAYPSFSTLEKISQALSATPIELFGTPKEIALSNTDEALDRIDKYSKKINDTIYAAEFIEDILHDKKRQDILYLSEILYRVFNRPLAVDEDGIPDIDEKTGAPRTLPSMFDRLPFDKIEKTAQEIKYIMDNYKAVKKICDNQEDL